MLYPCDISPAPVLCYSTAKLASAYASSALDVFNPGTGVTKTIGFSGTGLDTVALDAFLAGQAGLVLKWYDQISGKNISHIPGQGPGIASLTVGGARSIVFEGESQSGAVYGMLSDDNISSLGITAKDYSVVLVVQPSSSMYCNQAGAPDLNSGALFDLQAAGGAGTVAQLYSNSVLGDRGAWQVTDGVFDFVSPLSFVQINPIVIAITSNSTGVKVYQNGQIRATASRSALTRTAATLWLGRLASSIAGSSSQAGGFSIVAAMFYNAGLTQAQYAFVAAALYDRFSIDPRTSGFAANQVIVIGDSIPAGYKTLGIFGGAHYLQSLITKQPTRFLNFAVPGSTVTQNPAGGPVYANNLGLFPLAIAPQLQATDANKGRVVIIHAGGNDSFGPTGRAGTTNGTNVIAVADTTSLSLGDYVFASNIATLVTITNIVASTSITISGTTPSGSTVVSLQFLYAATSPALVKAGIQSLADQAIAAGATKVIVATILPRTQGLETWNRALNVLIKAGVTGATVVDLASFPGLNTIPGPSYADSAHLTALGHQQWAAGLLSEVESGLQN